MTRNNEPSYREKGRAVVLAALMVMSVVAMSAAFVGGAAAANDEITTSELDDGQDLYIGETIEITDLDNGDWYEIQSGLSYDSDKEGDLVQVENGALTYDTSGLSTGPHVVVNATDSSEEYGPFVMYEMDLNAEFDQNSIEQGDSETDVNLNVDFNRDNTREYNVTISETSDQLSEEDLEEIFDGQWVNDNGNVEVTVNDQEDGEDIAADFSNADLGEYEFEVESVDTGATDTATFQVAEDVDAELDFAEDTTTENVGDVVEIELDANNADEAWLELREDLEEDAYWANVTIDVNEENLDEGENVIVEFNTYKAAQGLSQEEVVNVTQGGSVSSFAESIDGNEGHSALGNFHLETGSYSLEVYADDPSLDATLRQDASRLTLEDRSLGEIDTQIAPAGADLDTVEAIENNASDYDDVAEGDNLVFEVDASGVYGYLLDENGQWSGNENLSMVFENADQSRFSEGGSFNASANADAFTIVEDRDEDRFFVVVDTDSPVTDQNDDSMDLAAGDNWDVTFTIGEDNVYVDENESVSTSFSVEDAELDFDTVEGDYQVTKDGENAWEVRSGSTYLAPGTEVTVTAVSNLLFEEETVEVEEVNGERMFTVTFDPDDTSEIELGHEFSLEASNVDNSNIDDFSTDAVVAEAPEWETSADSAALNDLLNEYDVNTVDELHELIGGLQNDSAALDQLLEDNDADNASDLQNKIDDLNDQVDELENQNEELNSTIEDLESENENLSADSEALAKLLEDNDVEDADALQTHIDNLEDKEPDNETDDTGNGDDGDSDDSDSNDDSNDDESDDGTPGFGVAVAAIALLAAAMLALRRQH